MEVRNGSLFLHVLYCVSYTVYFILCIVYIGKHVTYTFKCINVFLYGRQYVIFTRETKLHAQASIFTHISVYLLHLLHLDLQCYRVPNNLMCRLPCVEGGEGKKKGNYDSRCERAVQFS